MSSIHEKAVRFAVDEFHKHIHEIPAHSNRGPRVEYYQSFDFLAGGGYAWCVDFFLASWSNAGHALPYKSAGAYDLLKWARKAGWAEPLDHIIPGDGICFNIGSGHWGMYLDHTKTMVETVDGNWADQVMEVKHFRREIAGCMHVPEVIPPHVIPKKQPLYIVTTSANGHSQVIITQRTWKMLAPFLPKLIKNRGWNGFTIRRVK